MSGGIAAALLGRNSLAESTNTRTHTCECESRPSCSATRPPLVPLDERRGRGEGSDGGGRVLWCVRVYGGAGGAGGAGRGACIRSQRSDHSSELSTATAGVVGVVLGVGIYLRRACISVSGGRSRYDHYTACSRTLSWSERTTRDSGGGARDAPQRSPLPVRVPRLSPHENLPIPTLQAYSGGRVRGWLSYAASPSGAGDGSASSMASSPESTTSTVLDGLPLRTR